MRKFKSKSAKQKALNALTQRHLESLEGCFDAVARALYSPYEVEAHQKRAWFTIRGRIASLSGTKALIKRITKAMQSKNTAKKTEVTAFRDLQHVVGYNTL